MIQLKETCGEKNNSTEKKKELWHNLLSRERNGFSQVFPFFMYKARVESFILSFEDGHLVIEGQFESSSRSSSDKDSKTKKVHRRRFFVMLKTFYIFKKKEN